MDEDIKEWQFVLTNFLEEISITARARIEANLIDLAEQKHEKRTGIKSIKDGGYELKVKCQGDEYRCLFVYHVETVVVLVCFKKKTRKIPKRTLTLFRDRQSKLTSNQGDINNVEFN